MRPDSYFVELKKYLNVPLIIDYQIEEITYEFFNTKIKTNKWIDIILWFKIQEKLEELLKTCLVDFVSEEIFLSNNSVCVSIVKHTLEKRYAKFFEYEPKEMHPFIIRIYIKQNNNNNTVQTNNNVLKDCIEPKIEMIEKSLIIINNDNSTEQEITEKTELRTNEYNPLSPRNTLIKGSTELIPNENNFVPYKPSTQIETLEDNNLENDPYSPRPIDLISNHCSQTSIEESPDIFSEKDNTCNKVPKYKASPILNKSTTKIKKKKIDSPENVTVRSRSQRTQKRIIYDEQNQEIDKKSSINSIKKNDKTKIIKKKQLFGSGSSLDSDKSESDDGAYKKEEKVKKSHFIVKEKNICSTNGSVESGILKRKKSKTEHSGGRQKNLDKWLNADKIVPSTGKSNKIKSSKTLNKKIRYSPSSTSSKIISSDEVYTNPITISKKLTEEEREQHVKEINALNELNIQVKRLIKSPLKIDFKSLNHIPISKILNTFTQYKSLLDKHFNEFKSQKNRHVKVIHGLDHLALINVVDENYQLKMLHCLRDNYETPDDVPCYTDLFMALMLPEWILALFMNEYNLTRENAIKRLKDQEDAKICSQMDNSMFN